MKDMLSHKDRSLFGMPIQQSWASLFVIEKLLAKEKPTFVIELGTASGMLSHYLQIYAFLNTGTGFCTYDINEPKYRKSYNFYKEDVTKENVMKNVLGFLYSTEKPMILIDAFDPKSDLFNMYVPKLKSGTIILAHDYIINEDKPFRWGFRETDIVWDNVEKLEPYYSMSKQYDTRMLYAQKK